MSKQLYKAADQTAVVVGSPNTGVDIVPGQVVKLIFVALADFALTTTTALTSAAWQTFLADATKTHVVTGFIDNFNLEPTKPVSEGGNDSSTYNGVPRLRGVTYAPATGKISGIDNAQATAIRALASKSGNFQQGTRIGVFLIHEGVAMTGRKPSATASTIVRPLKCWNVFLGDPKKGGQGASDDYDIEFALEGGWSDEQQIYQLGFEGALLENPTPA